MNPNKYAVCAALISLLVFLRALTCDFINWDDPLYVTENPALKILDWQFIKESFSVSYMGWWMPLTWISFAIDYQLWGLNPFGYHLTNILLHSANTGLVVLIADQLLRRDNVITYKSEWYPLAFCLLSGLLWGVHPLRVESVVWVTERKDVLNGFFSLGSVLLYLHFVRRRSQGERVRKLLHLYLFSLIALLLSLTAKPISVVLPAMLLVMDWYPLRRLNRTNITTCVIEKIPYVVISAGMAFVTLFLAQGESILVSYTDFPFSSRLVLAGYSIFEYLKMSLYPVGLLNLYLLPRTFPFSYYFGAAVTLMIIVGCAAVWRSRPWYLSCAMLFLLPLIPVLGFFQNGAQAYADRFTYLPGVVLSIAAARFFSKHAAASGTIAKVVSVILVVMLATNTVHLTGAWRNSESLWTRVITLQPVGRAYFLRAEFRNRNGNYPGAIDDLAVSIDMGKKAGYPGVHKLHALRGTVLMTLGRFEYAAGEFSSAIAINPLPNYFFHRGLAYKALGKNAEAAIDFNSAGDTGGMIEW